MRLPINISPIRDTLCAICLGINAINLAEGDL